MTNDQKKFLKQITTIILETVEEMGPDGAPAGPMYMAMMHAGCTLEQFEQLMQGMVDAGLLVKRGHCYFIKR